MVTAKQLRGEANRCRTKATSGNTIEGPGQILLTLAVIAEALADDRERTEPVFKTDDSAISGHG